MATPTTAPPPPRTPITATTRRGFATASLALSLWGLAVFWWYPFGLFLASAGFVFGIISVACGFRAGKDGEHLALAGVAFGAIAIGLALAVYRFMQLAFEGSPTGGLWD